MSAILLTCPVQDAALSTVLIDQEIGCEKNDFVALHVWRNSREEATWTCLRLVIWLETVT